MWEYAAVQFLGYTHAKEGKVIPRYRFKPESVLIEADLLTRGVRERVDA
jgi:hypothetical protein